MTLKLQKLQNRAARIITGSSYLKRSSDVLHELQWMNLEVMRQRQKKILMFKILNSMAPTYLSEMFSYNIPLHNYGLCSSKMNLELLKSHTSYNKNSFAYTGAKTWNDIPSSLKEESSFRMFLSKLDS